VTLSHDGCQHHKHCSSIIIIIIIIIIMYTDLTPE